MVYSCALFELAVERDSLRQYSQELEIIRQAISKGPEYIELLFSPLLSSKEKELSLESVFSGASGDVMSFLKLLCDTGNIRLLIDEIHNFHKLEDGRNRILNVKIYSAVPLDLSQREILINKLENRYNMRLSPVFVIDKSVIGGIRIAIGDKVLDLSIKQKLKSIKEMIS